MIIDKNSWHYKLIKFMSDKIPKNLCDYIRILMYKLIILIFGMMFGIFILFLLGENMINWIYILTSNPFFSESSSLIYGLMCIGVGVLSTAVSIILLVIVVCLLAVIDKFVDKTRNSENVFFEYLKSKNEKVCKHITFVDSKKGE